MNLLDLFFPKQCLECNLPAQAGKFGKYICENCLKKVTPGGCDKNNYTIFRYEGVIRKAIIALKYKFAYDLSDELVSVCCARLSTFCMLHATTVLIPIPLHKRRENWRGFNQSEVIGKKIAEKMGWKFIPDLLIRTKNTAPQVGLKGLARRSNLTNVFCVNSNYVLSTMYSVLLFDDVYTTGSTINEAKKVLRDAGFKNIRSLTIAR